MNYSWIRSLFVSPARKAYRLMKWSRQLPEFAHCCLQRSRTVGWQRSAIALTLSASMLTSGCLHTAKKQPDDLKYADDIEGIRDYRGYNSRIEHPCLDNITPEEVQVSEEPRNLHRRVDDEVRDVTLSELIYRALARNEIIESGAFGRVGAATVLQNPNNVASVYDPAIQESGILFGRRGLDAALSDFDTQFSTSMIWGRSTIRRNTPATPGIGPIPPSPAAPRNTAETGDLSVEPE
jgi:hypothetical protein